MRTYSPNPFFSRSVSHCLLRKEIRNADRQPKTAAGQMEESVCLLDRNRMQLEMNAQGMKKIRLIALACSGGNFAIFVSHNMSRLPPPMPKPERHPSKSPTATLREKDVSIDNECLPRSKTAPRACEAIQQKYGCQTVQQETRRRYSRENRGMHPSMAKAD